jgi:hypothetical protein
LLHWIIIKVRRIGLVRRTRLVEVITGALTGRGLIRWGEAVLWVLWMLSIRGG